MTANTEIKSAESAELHVLWGMLEAHATLGNQEVQALLERWTEYVLAKRERYAAS